MEDKLAQLLYYYFESLLASRHPYESAGEGRALLEVAGSPGGFGGLLWASAAAAALTGILQPSYALEGETIVSRELVGPVPETLALLAPYGVVENLAPARRLCAPENVAAYIVAERALRELKGRSRSLHARLESMVEGSWIGQARHCIESGEDEEDHLAEALRRIEDNECPPRFQALKPFIEALLPGAKPGAREAPQGELYLDALAELTTLAAVLDVLAIPVDRRSYTLRTFRDNGWIVCYQHTLPLCQWRPDILVANEQSGDLIIVEVKSSKEAGQPLRERLEEGIKQLLLYKEAINTRGPHPHAPTKPTKHGTST